MTEEKCCSTEKASAPGCCETNVDRLMFRLAGIFVVAGVVLGYAASAWFYLLPLVVGANLVQASYTGFCPLAKALKKIGVKSGAAF